MEFKNRCLAAVSVFGEVAIAKMKEKMGK